MVASRKNAGHNHCVDEAPRNMRSDHLKHNGKGGGAGIFSVQARVGVRDVKTDEQN